MTKQKKVLVRVFIRYERTFILVFRHEDWLEILGQTGPLCKYANFKSIFAHNASAVRPSEKVQVTVMESTTRFSTSLKGLKTQNDRFSLQNSTFLENIY